MQREGGKLEISFASVLLLAAATLVASGVVFLLGIYVGKGIVESRVAKEARVVRLPVPTPGPAGKSDEVDVTFWDKLAKGEATVVPAPAPTATAIETPVRVVPSMATPAATPRPTEKKVESPPTPPPRPTSPPAVEGGAFQVQVNAMADRNRADELVRDLKGLGYSAFVSSARVADKTLYRVRIAGFASADAAKQAVTRLRDQGYPNAFLAAEGSER
jgi:septal ring-binding cell division protein DamX